MLNLLRGVLQRFMFEKQVFRICNMHLHYHCAGRSVVYDEMESLNFGQEKRENWQNMFLVARISTLC